MLYISIILIMGLLAAAAGGSLPGSNVLNKRGAVDDSGRDKGGISPVNLTWLPELAFAVVIGFCAMRGYENLGFALTFGGSFIVWAAAVIWSYMWMQTGHAAILPWDNVDKQDTRARDNTLTPFVHFLCRVLGIRFISGGKYTESYVWAFAAVKGFLIGLPVGAVPLAVLWPLGYEIGSHAKRRAGHGPYDMHVVSELSSGMGAGIACVLWLVVTYWMGQAGQ